MLLVNQYDFKGIIAMKIHVLALMFFTICAAAILPGCDESGDKVPGNIPQEARPIYLLFKAVKTDNPKLLQSVWSKRMEARFADEQTGEICWDDLIEMYSKVLNGEGDFKMTDVSFKFCPLADSDARLASDASGEITGRGFLKVAIKGKVKGNIRVVKEDGVWKMDER